MTVRAALAPLIVAIALVLPMDAGAVTCDGPAAPGVITGCGDATIDQLAPALDLDRSDLDRVDVARTPSGRVVRLQQNVDGVPVFNGQVALRYDESGNLDMVQTATISEPALSTVPSVSAADAAAAAGLETPVAELVVYPASDRPILAWHLQQASTGVAPNAIVDAHTGAVVDAWNDARYATADTPVFDPNPVQASNDTTLADGNDTDTDADTYAVTRTLDRLNSATSIAGEFAADLNPLAAPGDPSRSLMGGLTNFESANVYYAITEAQKKIQALGFTDVNNRTQGFNVNADPQDNSNYNSLTKDLTFGSGGVDDAEDAEVVLHEYGHSIQDNQVPGFGSGDEQGAMGEGFGDFFAGMYYLDRGNAAYQSARRYCIAEWDATTYNPVVGANDGSGCLRWIDGTDETDGSDIGKYSNTPTEVHDDGRFWSAGMTCIFASLGGDVAARNKVLKLVLDSQQSLVPVDDNTAFEKHIASMIVSDQNLYGGADVSVIRNCAALRGLATLSGSDPSGDRTPPEVSASVDPPTPDGGDGFYTRDVKVDWTVVDHESAVTTNGCGAVTIDRDTGDAGIALTCTATSAGGMTSKSVTIKRRSPADAKDPKTTFGKHPRKRTRRHRARFQFKSSEPGSSFECSLDAARFTRCSSPEKVRVKTGEHSFAVRATDGAGNVEAEPAQFAWTVRPRKHRHG